MSKHAEETKWLGEPSPPPVEPPLSPGDPAPWFSARSDINADFKFWTLGGRYVVLSFLGSFSKQSGSRTHRDFLAGATRFGAFTTALLLVTSDAADEGAALPASVPGTTRYFFDDGQRIAALFGVADAKHPITFILDERLRILAIVSTDTDAHAQQVFSIFDRLPALPLPEAAAPQAPVIIVPSVFEATLCRALVAGHEAHGGDDSGFMVEREGLTVRKLDYSHKRRADWSLTDDDLVQACHRRIRRRLVPEIWRAFQFEATRIERNLVACYTAADKGHFNRHRDNTTKGTAHRRFAVSINLNTEDYLGGDLVFPEFGRARFRPPTGGACVFSCSLLHEATTVTEGKRYVFVPFLYDDAAAKIRQQNLPFLSSDA